MSRQIQAAMNNPSRAMGSVRPIRRNGDRNGAAVRIGPEIPAEGSTRHPYDLAPSTVMSNSILHRESYTSLTDRDPGPKKTHVGPEVKVALIRGQ